MMENIKASWKQTTVKAAIIAVVIVIASMYLPWATLNGFSQSLMQAIHEDPDFFVGFLPVITTAAIWNIVFFLTNHPKLTLIGDIALLFMGASVLIFIVESEVGIGIGAWLYMAGALVSVVCAFATKKRKKAN